MKKKVNKSSSNRVQKFREEIRTRYYNDISQDLESMRTKGLFPFEGKWRSLEEIKALQELMRKKDRVICTDLITLFLIITLFHIVIILYLFSL